MLLVKSFIILSAFLRFLIKSKFSCKSKYITSISSNILLNLINKKLDGGISDRFGRDLLIVSETLLKNYKLGRNHHFVNIQCLILMKNKKKYIKNAITLKVLKFFNTIELL
jgi:hypothetical protein